MVQKSFGSARAIYNGVSYAISGDVTVKHGDFIDDNGYHYITEKKQHINYGSSPLRKAFSPEITFPLQAIEGFDTEQLFNRDAVNYNVTFGGTTYSIVGGFVTSDGAEINSGNGEVGNITVTGGLYRKITS